MSPDSYWFHETTVALRWSATDDLGLERITLYHRFSQDNVSWSDWKIGAIDETMIGGSCNGTLLFTAPEDGFYQFFTTAMDIASKEENALIGPEVSIGIDSTRPIGSILIDDGANWSRSIVCDLELTFHHTLSETIEGILGVPLMRVRLSNGTDWSTVEWELPSPSRSWTLTSSDGLKEVRFQIRSLSGLVSETYVDGIGLDTVRPTGSIEFGPPLNYTRTPSIDLTLNFNDETSGVHLYRLSEDETFADVMWTIPTESIEWDLSGDDGTKILYYQIIDNAGWTSDLLSSPIILDRIPPSGSISISAGEEFTASFEVELFLEYEDETSGIERIRVWEEGAATIGDWTTPETFLTFELSPGDGEKKVYFKCRDHAGWESGLYSGSIILDTTPPEGSIVINEGDELSTSLDVVLHLTYFDEMVGVEAIRVSETEDLSGAEWSSPVEEMDWVFTPGDGVRRIFMQVVDGLDHISDVLNDSILLENTPPTVITVHPSDGQEDVGVNVTIRIEFSEPMDHTNLVRWFALSLSGHDIPGAFTWIENVTVLLFEPTDPLDHDTLYSMTIGNLAKDMSGNSIASEQSFTFRTVRAPVQNGNGGNGGGDDEGSLLWIIVLIVIALLSLGVVLIILRSRR
jgi:hypothetical protein